MFPAVVVTGPRQSGKTTLVQKLFGESHAYCSLDDPAVRLQAQADPALLLQRFPPPVILDEIQYAPDLLHYAKLDIDRQRTKKNRFVITGSQLFPLMQGVVESLAGRAAVISLLSLSVREALGAPIEAFQKLFGKRAGKGLVVCLIPERFPLTRTVDAVPLGAF